VAEALGVAKQRLGVSEKVMSYRDRLRALKMRVAGHHPAGVGVSLRAKSLDHRGDLGCQLARTRAAVETEVEGDLVVARPARVQGGPGGRDLRQAPLDR
jgi:hypothetical protein